jgi:non-heme Fe2+,alpha-ketoglutarate-dependent halogenase
MTSVSERVLDHTADPRAALAADGFVFPFRALDADDSSAYRRRLEAYDSEMVDRGGAWKAFRHFPKVHLVADWADELIRHPRILDTVERLLGPDLLVWSTAIFVRPANSGDVLAWHQDALHYGLRGFEDGAVRVWLALTPTTMANGTMRFARGTHLEGIVAHKTDADRDTVRARGLEVDIEVDESRTVPVLLQAGQFSIHHLAVAHCSGPNSTLDARVNFAIDYFAPSVQPVGGPDRAMLVRGTDTHHHFELEERLPLGDPAATAHFKQSVAMRVRRLGGG